MEKRNCVFTGKEANSKLTITTDNHNWAKNVPCTKEYLASRDSEQLNELEIRLVELFYQQELCRARVENYEAQMAEIRSLMTKKPGKTGYADDFTQRVKSKMPFREFANKMNEITKRPPNFENLKEYTQEEIDFVEAPIDYSDHELTQEDIDWLNAPMGPLETTAEETKEALESIGFDEIRGETAEAEVPEGVKYFKGENHIKEPEVECEPEECPNPECPSILQYAPGIGPFCPNKECDVGDDPDIWKKEDKVLTEEKEDVKVEKKVVKKKLSGIWD